MAQNPRHILVLLAIAASVASCVGSSARTEMISATATASVPSTRPPPATVPDATSAATMPLTGPPGTPAGPPLGPSVSATRPTLSDPTPVSPSPLTTVGGSTGLEARTLLVGPGQPGRLYLLLADRGSDAFPSRQMRLLTSDDLGTTWQVFPGGLPAEPGCVNQISLDYSIREGLYASTCQGLYRWQTDTWTRVSEQATHRVAIGYGSPQLMWGVTRGAGSPIVRSIDGGKTWRDASSDLVHFNGVANLAVDPRANATLYAIIWPKYAGSYLRRGKPEGQWTTMPTPMNDRQIDIGMTLDGATGALYVSAFDGDHWQLWRSLDPAIPDVEQVKWERVCDFARGDWVTVLASGWSPQGLGLFVRASSDNGASRLFRSLDSGKTWVALPVSP